MKTPIFCSLQPAELLQAAGFELEFLDGDRLFAEMRSSGACAFHDNLCPYVKTVFDRILMNEKEYGIIVIPTGCDAQKKLYNALLTSIDTEKLFLLDFPQIKTEGAAKFLAEGLKLFNSRCHCEEPASGGRQSNPGIHGIASSAAPPRNDNHIAIIGANLPVSIIRAALEKHDLEPVFLNHCIEKARPDDQGQNALAAGSMLEYAKYLLQKNSCPRTLDETYKEALLKEINSLKPLGIIHLTFKFCDFQTFDHLYLRERLPADMPMLLVEHEGRTANEGQIMTRIEAFIEQIKKIKKHRAFAGSFAGAQDDTRSRYFVGIDSGSHATKMVCLDADGKLLFRKMAPTGTSIQKSVAGLLKEVPSKGFKLAATGYGRNQVADADEIITEITCHAKGVFHSKGKAGTIIDIGGQDSKAITLNEKGDISRFAMNDKCAAGTGRFLEVIADRLELSLEEFARLAVASKDALPVSNMCAVFAESEVISMIAKGHGTDKISKGIHQAIAERTASLVRRINGAPPYFMTGGVAKNPAIIEALSKELKAEITVIEEPQFSGAMGAALAAFEKSS